MHRSSKNLPIYLTVEEVNRILNAIKSRECNTELQELKRERDWLLIYVAVQTGLRCNELATLLVEHIELSENRINVMLGKGDKDRTVYVKDTVRDAIKSYLEFESEARGWPARVTGPLFRSNKRGETVYDGKGKIIRVPWGLRNQTIERIVRNAVERAGVTKSKKITTHTFRHTFACQSIKSDIPLSTLQAAMGHSNLDTTAVYLRAIQAFEDIRDDYSKDTRFDGIG